MQGLTFSGPSADWLMRVVTTSTNAIGFDYGLIPGVLAGAFLGAMLGKDFVIEGFEKEHNVARYIFGAILMGFGSVLAGGCAVGAGLSGGAVFSLTAWIALFCMWAGAGIADKYMTARSA